MDEGGSEPAIRLRSVSKRFGAHTALHGLDLDVPRGSIYGLLGPNGSGKTTTIRLIMGLLGPDSGTVDVLGSDSAEVRRKRVGYLPEERGVYRKMEVLEFLSFLAEVRGIPRVEARSRAGIWLDRLELAGWARRRVEDLSRGMQQKVQFAGAVLHEPELLVLDEPFSGLDPIHQDVLEETLQDLHGRGTTILLSTHLMDHAERLCQRACLLSDARKVLDGNLREVRRRERTGVVALVFEGGGDWIDGPEVLGVERVKEAVHVFLGPGEDPRALLLRGALAGAVIHRFELVEPRLHEIFVRLTAGRVSAAGGTHGPEAGARELPARGREER